jgi:hypothetical protein
MLRQQYNGLFGDHADMREILHHTSPHAMDMWVYGQRADPANAGGMVIGLRGVMASVAITPAAPPRFSTTPGWPKFDCMVCAIT